jgi:hypothetical protein
MSDQKSIKGYLSEDLKNKFNAKVEKIYGNKRSATLVIRKLAIKFINGDIDLKD